MAIRKYLPLLVVMLGIPLCSLWVYCSRSKVLQPVGRKYDLSWEDKIVNELTSSSPPTLKSLDSLHDISAGETLKDKDGGKGSVSETVQQCMTATHLDHSLDTRLSQRNAQYLFNEFRKVIPEHSLEGYLSHCWKTLYSVRWTDSHIDGYIGNASFDCTLNSKNPQTRLITRYLTKEFPSMKFESDMLCLPNLFLAGFPKCGSTYLYCVVNKLVDLVSKRVRTRHEAVKEPHFWVSANTNRDMRVPSMSSLQSYILNFIPGLQRGTKEKSSSGHSQVMLLDGSPNMFFKWPKFRPDEPDLTNYCLIPSVLPNLLPQSKYLVVMRNPVKMMYSAFWFSCTTIKRNLPMSVQLRGPHVFHDRVRQKLDLFNNCMIDHNVPQLNSTCSMESKEAYSRCIMGRLHLLDKCVTNVTFNNFSPELAGCGRTRLAMGIYYSHIRKWLKIVSKKRFLFLTLEDLVKDAKPAMVSVLEFLGLSWEESKFDNIAERVQYSCDTNSQSSVNYSKDPRLKMRKDTSRILSVFFHPFNQLLGELINRTSLWST